MILLSWVMGFLMIFLLLRVPVGMRRPIVMTVTFLGGAYWVLYWLWPMPTSRVAGAVPKDVVESVAFWVEDAVPVVTVISNVIAQMLLGLGVYSILHLHVGRMLKKQKDWGFSLLLLMSMLAMVIVGYWDWVTGLRKTRDGGATLEFQEYARDLLFDGLLQQMDAAMFSLVAFFIFSAAYRAFRIRSVEATIMLATAMLVMLSLLGLVEYASARFLTYFTKGDPGNFLNNFQLLDLSEWVRSNLERPSIRALEFGLGIGGLAIALRIWLGLDRGGANVP
jgi:hypothetical protein